MSSERPFWMDAGEELRLVRAARRGNGRAYADLSRWYHASLFRVAYALTRSEADAVLLVEETVERGLKAIRSMPQEQRFFPWWLRTARNLALVRLRRLAGTGETGPHGRVTAVDTGRLEVATVRDLEQAVTRLELDDQVALALLLVEGLTYGQIEKVLMVPPGSVLPRISMARTRIQDSLEPGRAAA